MFSKQDTFDRVYLGLKAQDFQRATNNVGSCVFQNSNNLRCAIGHLPPDNLLPKNATISSLLDLDYNFHDFHDYSLVLDLMKAHDQGTTPFLMQNMLEVVAHKFKLEIPNDPPV